MVLTKLLDSQVDVANFQFSQKVIAIQSNGAKEYRSLSKFVASIDIKQNLQSPYTPEHNAVGEWVIRTLLEAGCSLLIQAGLPNCLGPCSKVCCIHWELGQTLRNWRDTPEVADWRTSWFKTFLRDWMFRQCTSNSIRRRGWWWSLCRNTPRRCGALHVSRTNET